MPSSQVFETRETESEEQLLTNSSLFEEEDCRSECQTVYLPPLHKATKMAFTDALHLWGVRLVISASVAQWIEHQIPVLRVGGSSPSGRAKQVSHTMLQMSSDIVVTDNN